MQNQSIPGIQIQSGEGGWWVFTDAPVKVSCAYAAEDVWPALKEAESGLQQGYVVAGMVSYEAAAGLDPALPVEPRLEELPLVWLGWFAMPEWRPQPVLRHRGKHMVGSWEPPFDEGTYADRVNRIKACIAQGETYQVNFTLPLQAPFQGCPAGFFHDLYQAQGGPYAAYVQLPEATICCASPELFFARQGTRIQCRPMKGTAPRACAPDQDLEHRQALQASEKDRAENLMIVDMIRNDLGKIATYGSVKVDRLFDIEQYATLYQMTSTVRAETDADLAETFKALFPCASITGAPKRQTMEIIRALEEAPRGVYTGSIGAAFPDGTAQFNVAIRTALLQPEFGRAEYRVGGGIVWDSEPSCEFAECRTKALALTQNEPCVELFETLFWHPKTGYAFQNEHVERLQRSAAYFDYPFDIGVVEQKLRNAVDSNMPTGACVVKLLLHPDGTVETERRPAPSEHPPQATPPDQGDTHVRRVCLAPWPVCNRNRFLYHKTTHRQIHRQFQNACPHVDDVLLWNQAGELMESTIANLVVEMDEEFFTPPVQSGLLPGTMRRALIERGLLKERVLTRRCLKQADRVYLINSVRGWMEVELCATSEEKNPEPETIA